VADDENWFERVWEYREETLYPRIFGGPSTGGIYTLFARAVRATLPADHVRSALGLARGARSSGLDSSSSPPAPGQTSWRYVTSGLSNAWSGTGMEFVLETPENAEWAIDVTMVVLAYQILLAAGRYEGAVPLSPYDRVSAGAPIDPPGARRVSGDRSRARGGRLSRTHALHQRMRRRRGPPAAGAIGRGARWLA
jgi:hypothetical protein